MKKQILVLAVSFISLGAMAQAKADSTKLPPKEFTIKMTFEDLNNIITALSVSDVLSAKTSSRISNLIAQQFNAQSAPIEAPKEKKKN